MYDVRFSSRMIRRCSSSRAEASSNACGMRDMYAALPVRRTSCTPPRALGSDGYFSSSIRASSTFFGSTCATAILCSAPRSPTMSTAHQSAMTGTARVATEPCVVGGFASLSLLFVQIGGRQRRRGEIRQSRPDLDVDVPERHALMRIEDHRSRAVAADCQREDDHRLDAFPGVRVAHLLEHRR